MQRFYAPYLDTTSSPFDFPPDESKHMVKVLRKKEGDILHATDGKGQLFRIRILQAHPRHCTAEIVDVSRDEPSPYRLRLAVAPPKNIARFEWFLEKATEIGVHEITPLFCERSERNQLKQERLTRILESAMKQSLRTFLPTLNPAIALPDFLLQAQPGLNCIAHCAAQEKTDLKDIVTGFPDLTILIGPEGDFTDREIRLALDKGYRPVSLGQGRLRTETAAIVAATTVALLHG